MAVRRIPAMAAPLIVPYVVDGSSQVGISVSDRFKGISCAVTNAIVFHGV